MKQLQKNRILPIKFLVVITLFIFSGCTSHEKTDLPQPSHQTAPGEYFPAYPDSWWNYRNQNNEIIQYTIDPGYSDYGGYWCTYFSQSQKHVWGTSLLFTIYVGHGMTSVGGSKIYSTNVGEELECRMSFATFQYEDLFSQFPWRRTTIVADTTITLSNQQTFNNVIVVKETQINNPGWLYYEYFSKNVGLIKRDSASVHDSTQLTQILMLEDYHIGE